MTAKEALEKLKESGANRVKLAVTDIDGILRGKIVSIEKFQGIAEGGFGFCDVVFGWDSGDVAYDNVKYTGWHTGYPDAQAVVDMKTLRFIPWDDNTPFFLADFVGVKGEGLEVCPRSLLKKVIAQANKQGFSPFFSQEFEWFNFLEDADDLHSRGFTKPQPLTPGMFGYSILRSSQNSDYFNDLFDLLKDFGVPLEGLHTETGPGVYEAAITYSDALEAADRAVLFKSGVKEIAHRHGIIPSFMAKFNETLPGCSGHVHQSLWDGNKNVFYDEKAKTRISKTMESYMAGQLLCLPYILPMLAPTINSYKRLVVGAWAPTTLTWAIDNRTTALRALPSNSKSTRLETRVVGSDSNPYLAMAACLAAGLYGIRKGLKLETAMTIGNGYADLKNGSLPGNLFQAAENMANSDIAKELFGEAFVEHFTQTRFWEWRQFNKVVTDWELKRYFEVI